jgi:hypothetical protein
VRTFLLLLLLAFPALSTAGNGASEVPDEFIGTYGSMSRGHEEATIEITKNRLVWSFCVDQPFYFKKMIDGKAVFEADYLYCAGPYVLSVERKTGPGASDVWFAIVGHVGFSVEDGRTQFTVVYGKN